MEDSVKLNYDDIAIVPEETTEISSRCECDPFDEDGYLPIFASCMSSIVSKENIQDFNNAKIKCVLPRNYSLSERMRALHGPIGEVNFIAFSLKEAHDLFVQEGYLNYYCPEVLKTWRICIDLANGHMKELLQTVKAIKEKYGDRVQIMTGNIANPETYRDYCKAGVDYVRCSIGTGNCCLTGDAMILMEDGSKKPIREVKIGDKVRCSSGNERTVTNTFIRTTTEIIRINDKITCTPDHKFLTTTKDEFKTWTNNGGLEGLKVASVYIEAQNLTPENMIWEIQDLGNGLLVNTPVNIESLSGVLYEETEVYDIEVSEEHNYIANDYIVHNCSTSSNTGVHYPVFSLLQEIYTIKKEIGGKCKIIADGGIRGYRDIQKALLYSDYVMIGSLFGRAMESAGKTTIGKSYWNLRGYKILRPLRTLLTYGQEIPREDYDAAWTEYHEGKLEIYKEIYGMSTKKAQSVISEANGLYSRLKTSEGLVKKIKVEFKILGWVENEIDYLRSAMSYTDSRNLEEYKDKKWTRITQIRYNN